MALWVKPQCHLIVILMRVRAKVGTYVCLDFHGASWYDKGVPTEEPQGSKDTLASGERPRIGNPKGE